MVHIADRLKNESFQTKLIMQVHDELVFEAPNAELPKLEEIVREEMQKVLTHPKVTLLVDIGTGVNWLEAK